ncbi:MAG: sugar ABC transporter ATP-binding protein [Candidatus Limiplasma sp.]|nr:sugar ABC transporter ATP-binding protein [Candidatus Limiplasma sp.]
MKLEVKDIVKDYPGCRALDHVSLELESGKVYALLGKNGSGKSTLVKILAGAIDATEGEVLMDGQPLKLKTPKDAQEKGIVTVYQEMSLIPGLTVAENIFLNRVPKRNGVLDWKTTYRQAGELLKNMGVAIDPHSLVSDLSMWQKQIVEITRAMSLSPKVLMLDEPTSSLAQSEVQNLLKFVRALKEKDIIVIYITHKLQELNAVADEIIVLRDGALIGQRPMSEMDNKKIVNMMFGEVQIRKRPEDVVPGKETVMSVRALSSKGKFQDVSFDLRKGEVLGIAGMLGSGRTELLRAIFGADPFDSGAIEIAGKTYRKSNPIRMIDAGVGLTPEERKTQGVILIHSVLDNLNYASIRRNTVGKIFEDKKNRRKNAKKQVDNLQIRIPEMDSPCSTLSGGNQQKVVVGNWLSTEPRIMLYDEPSRGIDVNAKQQIFEIMWQGSKEGISTVFVSTELEELLEVCTRILIMCHGRIVGQVNPDKCPVNDLYACCMSGTIPQEIAFEEERG